MKTGVRTALAAAIIVALPAVAMAQHDQHFGDQHWGGDIHHFNDHDMNYWRGGRWVNAPHGGRNGWWWVVGPSWYYYPSPVYPYPDPYLPPTAAPGAGPTWFYCGNPQGYYPYVGECSVPWQPVPAQ